MGIGTTLPAFRRDDKTALRPDSRIRKGLREETNFFLLTLSFLECPELNLINIEFIFIEYE